MTNIYTCSASPPQVNVAQDQLPQFLKTAERLKVMAGGLVGCVAGRTVGRQCGQHTRYYRGAQCALHTG